MNSRLAYLKDVIVQSVIDAGTMIYGPLQS
jgi:hypothetical protein